VSARDAYVGLRAFVDELARCGVREACTSPGSRSTPLVLSLARDPRIRASSHLDERCAAFFALGIAKASGVPAVLACTSGTATANYAPAVIEAHEARVPLLVLTADRPPELRDLGAGQTIDQTKLYGSAAKWFFEVDAHRATPERLRWLRQLARHAFWTAVDGRPGPVHLNFSLREPLVLDGPLPEDDSGRAGGRPWVTRPRVAGGAREPLVDILGA
jgi:2-succinyl-5-enolpyruvyl-6-hydroxy-3-cyclohexene-1-carboxylate synthase